MALNDESVAKDIKTNSAGRRNNGYLLLLGDKGTKGKLSANRLLSKKRLPPGSDGIVL